MDLLKDYLLKSPPTQPILPTKPHKKTQNQYEYFNFQYRKRTTSLADMYTTKLNQLPHNNTNRRKSMPHVLTHKQIEVINNYRIEKTIDSLNQYTQQLQLTLINQYKPHKQHNFRQHKNKNNQPLPSNSQITSYETINDIFNQDIKNKKHPQRTLYETFMNYGVVNKTNDQPFNLQAVKLPIVDRFDHNNHNKYQSQFKGKIYPKEEVAINHTKIKFHPQKYIRKERSNKSREGEIIPWNTPEQDQLD